MVRFLLLALLGCLPWWAHAASIMAQLDRNPVALGDPVTLTLTADGVVGNDPDFAPLLKDFEIRSRSQSNSFSMVNGVSSVRTEWSLILYPRNTGILHIPPISFGAEQSQALDLQVLDQPPPSSAGGGGADLLVELEAEPKQPYVQQQTLVTQRILHIQPLQPQATLSHPVIEAGKGDIRQIGNTRNYTLMRDGRNWQVIERRYALVPQQSGTLTIGRAAFEGVLAEPGPSSYDPFGVNGKRIRRFSQPLTLQIQGQPATYTGQQWLPAKSITLNAHWQTAPDKLQAGEPVTLTLAIMADGLAAEQLPKLDVQMPAGIKAYTDKPELRNDAGNDGVVGVRQEKWVIVAPYNGEYAIPAINLTWWNSTAGKQETASINPVTMRVSGGQAAPAGEPAVVTPPPVVEPDNKPQAPPVADDAGKDLLAGLWGWLTWERLAFSLLLLWVVLSFGWLSWRWLRKPAKPASLPLQKTAAASGKNSLRVLEQACRQNQAQAAHDALLAWADSTLGLHPALITTLREQADPSLRSEIDKLLASLYGREAASWQGSGLWKAVQAFKPVAVTPHSNHPGLATLYPE